MIQATLSSRFPTLAVLRRQAGRFLAWWLAELGALVPSRLRRWWQGYGDALLVSLDGTRLRLSEPAGPGLREVLAADIAGESPRLTLPNDRRWRETLGAGRVVFLALPRGEVLERTLTFPAALAENLRQSLAFELDRYTPFRPDQAYFDYRVVRRPDSPASITVDLLVAPRTLVDAQLARLAELGVKPSGVVLAEEFGRPEGDFRNLLPSAEGTRRSSGRMRPRLAFLALAGALTIALLALPIWQKRSAAVALLEPVAQARSAAQEADARRTQLTKLAEEHDLLPNMKWATPSVTEMIEELSKLLPDDTFVMQFDFGGKNIQVIGETGSSTGLVETLERSPFFKDVAFKSPLTKIQGSPFDRFHLSADLEPPARTGAAPAGAGAPQP